MHTGLGSISIALGLFSLCVYLKLSVLSLVLLLSFWPIMTWTVGGIHWVYLPEICSDVQFGFISTTHYTGGVVISLSTEYMMKKMTPGGTFMCFSLLTFTNFLLMLKFAKETKGLTDKEKKQLFRTTTVEVLEYKEVELENSLN